jgi:hypothetical protein
MARKQYREEKHTDFNMASFPRLSLDFVKADLAKSAARNFLRIRVFHVDLLPLPLLGLAYTSPVGLATWVHNI